MVKNIIGYLLFLLITFLGLAFFRHYLFAVILFIMVILPFITVIINKMIINKIHINIDIKEKIIEKNHPINLIIKVHNSSCFPSGNLTLELHIENNFYKNKDIKYITLPTGIKTNEEVIVNINPIYSGRVSITAIKVSITDILRIFKNEKQLDIQKDILISPDIRPLKHRIKMKMAESGDEEGCGLSKGFDVTEISQIRSYIEGDNLANIHWKLTAKKDDFMVKDYSLPHKREITLLIDLYKYYEKGILDILLDAYFSYAHYLLKDNIYHKLCWFNSKTGEMEECNIENEGDSIAAMNQLYYSGISDKKTKAYDIYKNINGNYNTVWYFTLRNLEDSIQGYKVGEYGENVVILCL